MPITLDSDNLAIPRGVLRFDEYKSGAYEGDREIGESSGFTVSVETLRTEKYTAKTGVQTKILSKALRIDRKAKIVCENMSLENFAFFIGGDVATVTQTGGSVTDEAIAVKQGLSYRLGRSASTPTGVRAVSAVDIQDDTDTTTYVEGTDYELDAAKARIKIIAGGGISDDDTIHVDYTEASNSRQQVSAGQTVTRFGRLTSDADNNEGANLDFEAPYASITPEGELPVITEATEVVSINFEVEILEHVNTAFGYGPLYIDGRPA